MQNIKNIVDWNHIKNDYKNGSLIVGNGGSIAISENFNYSSLYNKACETKLINDRLKKIFSAFNTKDFETVLHKLLQEKIVTEALSINNDQITEAYGNCRGSLINAIQKIHPKYEVIDSEPVNDEDQVRYGHRLKDCFTEKANGDNCFNLDWKTLREPHRERRDSTLIFYLHGNLTLADFFDKTTEEREVKITSPGADHLQVVYDKWKTNHYSPLFVCEGKTNRKLTSIKKSNYLSAIYNDVFNDLGNAIAIYGWSMGSQDDHVLKKLGRIHRLKPFKKIAISVVKNGDESVFIDRVTNKVHDKINDQLKIHFYDSASSNCWNNE